MKEVTDEMFSKILSESGSQYFIHREDTGRVEIVFETGICKVEPGEEDSIGRIWNPPTTDAQGNPLLDFNGNPREPWAKYEAKVLINGASNVYSFSGEKSSILRNFIQAMNREGIKNVDLPGTKWTIDRIGRWDWDMKYLGKGDNSPSPSTESQANLDPKIIEALKVKKDQSVDGIPKNDMLAYLAFVTHLKAKDLEVIWPELISTKLIEEKDGKVYIL
jgi:hypothetical protein